MKPLFLLLATTACAAGTVPPAAAQREAAPALSVAPLAGQRVPVLPVTLISVDEALEGSLPADRAARLTWADSLLGEELLARGPEVTWVLPPELRAAARRAPATVTDPDRMGHALMRATDLKQVPDPLRSYIRALTAMTNSRLAFIPASMRFSPDTTGVVRLDMAMVLADSRNGAVVWRSHPSVTGATPAAALRAAIRQILPDYD